MNKQIIKENILKYKKAIILSALILFIVLRAVVALASTPGDIVEDIEEKQTEEVSDQIIEEDREEVTDVEPTVPDIYVDIKGSVKNPNVYKMNKDNRIIDVIEKAGGLIENADTTTINLSKKLSDQMIIFIPLKDELAICNYEEEQVVEEDQEETPINVIEKPPRHESVNINTGTLEELAELPRIGNVVGHQIIYYREENGPYTDIEELLNVKGIGESIFATIKPFVYVD